MWRTERSLIFSIGMLWHAVSFYWDIQCVQIKGNRKDVTLCHKHIGMVEVMFDEQRTVRSVSLGCYGMLCHYLESVCVSMKSMAKVRPMSPSMIILRSRFGKMRPCAMCRLRVPCHV